ncbi:trace amine-associated receptor 4-like [Harmonia axyridis]|uniref:trace amine-associated receptor 4-like n=1 Tax=Harmonia axyridis TaxID=115357 RepID=UPI001E27737F|nr:trace amine-associated receptor 4-like [Harmonia axyridis]
MHNSTNSSIIDSDIEVDLLLVKNVKLVLCSTCILAVLTNFKVFTCILWIRKPITSILKISLSLAMADSCASCISGIVIFFEDYITFRFFIILDMVKLCFILVTVFHLLSLAVNHYMGIHKPLHHNSKSSQSMSGVLFILWTIPTLFLVGLYTIAGGHSFWISLYNDTLINDTLFIHSFRFRMAISSFIVISMICIIICYISILLIIRKQKKIWNKVSFGGSVIRRGRHINRKVDRHTNHVQIRLKGNSKAVYTTLIIMVSCLLGWIPALTIYAIACSQDCLISGELLNYVNEKYRRQVIMLRFFDNEMLFLKMIANPIIYSIRMKELRDGNNRMHNAILYYLGYRRVKRREGTCTTFVCSGFSNTAQRYSMRSQLKGRTNMITTDRSQKDFCRSSYL